MKPLALVGVVLIIVGIIALAYQGITYTSDKHVVDLGPLKIEAKERKTIPLPPLVGGVAVIVGLALVVLSRR